MNDAERHEVHHLAKAISELACALGAANDQRRTEFEWHKSHPNLATKLDLDRMETRIMSALSDQLAKIANAQDAEQAAITKLQVSADGLTKDIADLKALIKQLQDSQGAVTPEDQALIDKIQSTAEGASTKLGALSDSLGALDDSTPGTPPTP